MLVQHVGRACKSIQDQLTKEIRNIMLDECLNCLELSSNIFRDKNVGSTSSSMARKPAHFCSTMWTRLLGPYSVINSGWATAITQCGFM